MWSMNNNINLFIEGLNNDLLGRTSISCNNEGIWWHDNWLMRLIRWIIPPLEDLRLINISRQFEKVLDRLEAIPVQFDVKANLHREFSAKYLPDMFAEAGQLIAKCMILKCRSLFARQQMYRLLGRVIALEYRCRLKHIKNEYSKEKEYYEKLHQYALEWRKNEVSRDGFPEDFSEKKLSYLKEACKFKIYAKFLTMADNFEERRKFFSWTLRNKIPPQALIEFPSMRDDMHLMYPRFGRLNNSVLPIDKNDEVSLKHARENEINPDHVQLLRIKHVKYEPSEAECKDDYYQKELQVLVKGEDERSHWVTFLDRNKQVRLKHNKVLAVYTVRQILDMFARKNERDGDLEVAPDGITNWCCTEMAPVIPHVTDDGTIIREIVRIELNKSGEEFLKQLPTPKYRVFEKHKHQYIKQETGHVNANHYFGMVYNRKRKEDLREGLSPTGTHAYVRYDTKVVVNDIDYIRHYPFGKTMSEYPNTSLGMLKAFLFPQPNGRIIHMDVSQFETNRQFLSDFYPANKEEAEDRMSFVKDKIQLGWDNHLNYWMNESCASFGLDVVEPLDKTKSIRDKFVITYHDVKLPLVPNFLRYAIFKVCGLQDRFYCPARGYHKQ